MSFTKYRQLLNQIAKESIAYGLEHGQAMPVNLQDYVPELQVERATFVTLEINHQLRGCIGMLDAVRPLVIDLAENAYAAAFRDSRFSPVTKKEIALLQIHLSILSLAEPINFYSEEDLVRQLRPGIDGLILQEGAHRGTFLPCVWDKLNNPAEFIKQLKKKSGLSVDYWSDSLRVSRYQCEVIAQD